MQQEYFGFGKIALLPDVLALNNATRPLFVTGQASFSGSGAETAIRSCLPEFSRYPRFSSFSVNPKLDDALTGCEILLREQCDSIVAVGGGSPIDMAKAISAIHGDLEHAREVAIGSRALSGNPLPLIVVPTTAGTGSEATHFAVIYVDGLKYSLADVRLLPTATIIDPELTLAVSAHQTACSGFDA
ncbi:MAG: iron-containing alcohol dehydrogenase, partial [Pseudomonadales bacterium]